MHNVDTPDRSTSLSIQIAERRDGEKDSRRILDSVIDWPLRRTLTKNLGLKKFNTLILPIHH